MAAVWPQGSRVAVIAWGKHREYEPPGTLAGVAMQGPANMQEVSWSAGLKIAWRDALKSMPRDPNAPGGGMCRRGVTGLDQECWPTVMGQIGFVGFVSKVMNFPAQLVMLCS